MRRKVPTWDPSYPKFDIDSLDGPEDLTTLYDKTLKDYTSETLEKLLKHYGWGFKDPLDRNDDKAIFRHLVKIVHYMRDDLKPSQKDFEKCDSDAGPGLLRQECSALQFSLDHPHPPPAKDHDLAECLRKAIFRYPYQSLERCPSAFPIKPNATKNNRPQDDEQGATDGLSYGQGAVKHKHLDNILDCAIAAAYMLDAGCTKADRATLNWHSAFRDQAKCFLKLIWIDWGCDSDYHTLELTSELEPQARLEQVRQLKSNITKMLGQKKFYAAKYRGRVIGEIWERCTGSFRQFLVRYTQNHLHTGNTETPEDGGCTAWSTTCIPLKGIGTEPSKNTIPAQAAFFFKNKYSATEKRGNPPGLKEAQDTTQEIERRFHKLPLRLTFVTDPESPPSSHTATDIPIKYCDPGRKWRIAKYRWLGGIYPITSGNSFRYVLFWSDHKRHEKSDKGKLRKYAPHECNWQIREGFGFKGSEASERVPVSKWRKGRPALLFYERVLGPEEGGVEPILKIAKNVKFADEDPVISEPDKSETRPKSRTKSSSQTVGVPVGKPPQGVRHPTGYPKAAISSKSTNPQMVPPRKLPGPTQRGPLQSSRAQPAQTTGERQYGHQAIQYARDSGQPSQGTLEGQAPLSHAGFRDPSRGQWLSAPQQGQIDQQSMSGTQMLPQNYFPNPTNSPQEFGLSPDNVGFANPSEIFSLEYLQGSSRISTAQTHEHGEVQEPLLLGTTSYTLDPSRLGLPQVDSSSYTNFLKPMGGSSAQPGHAPPSSQHAGGETFSAVPASSIPPLPDTGPTPLPLDFGESELANLLARQQTQEAEHFGSFEAQPDMYRGDAPFFQESGTHKEPAKRKESPEYESEESSASGKKQRK
ncbi:hypothetical protein GX51_06571 [Blastomyces parvus]|uniref:Uncharacterized protein n=1 Tax=Blastomyces parvus TaxID=2060905 RepID=A0A2B7WQH5_9EURO|nr:hypothetical protein GX51_06571 [Blastomyces parvus]